MKRDEILSVGSILGDCQDVELWLVLVLDPNSSVHLESVSKETLMIFLVMPLIMAADKTGHFKVALS